MNTLISQFNSLWNNIFNYSNTNCSNTNCSNTNCSNTNCSNTNCSNTNYSNTNCSNTNCSNTNCSNTNYSNIDINPGSNIKIKNDNEQYIVIGSNINNDLICCKSTEFYNTIKTTIINKSDIIDVFNNKQIVFNKKISFDN